MRLAVVAHDIDDLAAKVTAAAAGQTPDGVHRRGAPAAAGDGAPQVAFLLPGRAAATPGMAADLLVAFPRLRDTLRTGREWFDALFPPQGFGDDDRGRQAAALADAAEPAVAVADLVARRRARAGGRACPTTSSGAAGRGPTARPTTGRTTAGSRRGCTHCTQTACGSSSRPVPAGR